MSTLTATSTFNDARAAYRANASYQEDQSPAKAAAFITACQFLIDFQNDVVAKGGVRVEKDTALYERQMQRAQQWLAVNNAGASSGVRTYAFSDVRA